MLRSGQPPLLIDTPDFDMSELFTVRLYRSVTSLVGVSAVDVASTPGCVKDVVGCELPPYM
jgi:hypothetical protein